jgi:hypothetical protein
MRFYALVCSHRDGTVYGTNTEWTRPDLAFRAMEGSKLADKHFKPLKEVHLFHLAADFPNSDSLRPGQWLKRADLVPVIGVPNVA